MLETLCAAAPISSTDLVQVVVPDSNLNLHQAPAVRGKLIRRSNSRVFRVVVATMARPVQQRGQSLLRRLEKSAVNVPSLQCPLGALISILLTDTASVRSRGRNIVNNFPTSAAMRLEKVIYTSSIFMARYATYSRSKKRFRVKGEGLVAPPVKNPDRLSDGSARRIRWSVQRIVTA